MPEKKLEPLTSDYGDFSDIHGQEVAKRAMIIAAAGMHNVLLSGPPGTGKSMLAQRLLSILPPLEPQEALEVTMIHSMAHILKEGHLMRKRPFRNPHHSVSMAALVGGGFKGLPGEISLAHGGILFLDELPEFSKQALDSLRQSLESHTAVVARANYRVTYPARFQWIAAMNPCRCGYLGNINRQCHKAPLCATLYQQTISGPLLDRLDLFVEVPDISSKNLATSSSSNKQSPAIQKHVQKSWDFQKKMNFSRDPLPHEMDQDIQKDPESRVLLLKAMDTLSLSVRGYYRILRVARSIANLEESDVIRRPHVSEALSYRDRFSATR